MFNSRDVVNSNELTLPYYHKYAHIIFCYQQVSIVKYQMILEQTQVITYRWLYLVTLQSDSYMNILICN